MNPMSLMLAPAPAAAASTSSGATPARGASEGAFAQCLGHAVEREPVAADAATAPEASAAEPAEAADTTNETPADARPARGARRAQFAGHAGRKAEPAQTLALAGATAPRATPAEGTGQAEIPSEAATPSKAKPATEGDCALAQLLPGWPPATAPSVPATAAAAAVAAAGQGTALAAAVPMGPPAPPSAQIEALAGGTPAPKAEDPSGPATFALPPPIAPNLAANTPPVDTTPPEALAHVAAPVDSPAFAPALATQVRWLVRDGLQHAQLSLNPAEMGPVTVQIVLDGREARIDFRADMAATRHAIEASLPVLAAALDDSGLRLAGGGVHDGQAQHQGQPGWAMARAQAAPGAPADEAAARSASPPNSARIGGPTRGLVDLVA